MPRPHAVGWGYTDGDPITRFESSDFVNGGSAATQKQQVLDIPVLNSSMVSSIFIEPLPLKGLSHKK